jgi:hypothetical protein
MAITGKVSSKKMTEAGDILTGNFFVKRITWIDVGATDGDSLILTNGDGDIVTEDVAIGTTWGNTFYLDQWVSDLKVDTMTAGYVIIFVE